MTSHPSESCCYQGFQHGGQPQGTLSMLDDIEIYTSHPPDGSTEYGLLVLTDIIGHRFINAQLIADQFAMNGYLILMPDLFYGDPVPLNKPGEFNMQMWRSGEYHPKGTNHLPSTVDHVVEACLRHMRTELNCKKIGAVGYCFGGKYVVRYLRPGQIDVGYTAHPSHIEAEELISSNGPLAIAAAEHDSIFPAEKRQESEGLLKELKVPYQINLYSGVSHGFAVRGNQEDSAVRYAQQNSFLQAVEWFRAYLRNDRIPLP